MILDSDYQALTVLDDSGKIFIRNIDEYNLLKYRDFNGGRIILDLDKDTNITETFNNGIFNVSHKKYSMQIKDRIELAKRIMFCQANNTIEPIKELLLNKAKKEINETFLIASLSGYGDKIIFKDNKILIDDVFAVDKDGQAYFIIDNEFHRLCIVAGKIGQLSHKLKHTLGKFEIDFRTMEIYNKVLFLLFPNVKDNVFMNQLPKNLKSLVKGK